MNQTTELKLMKLLVGFYANVKEMQDQRQILTNCNVFNVAEVTLKILQYYGFDNQNCTSKILRTDDEVANRMIDLDRIIENIAIEAKEFNLNIEDLKGFVEKIDNGEIERTASGALDFYSSLIKKKTSTFLSFLDDYFQKCYERKINQDRFFLTKSHFNLVGIDFDNAVKTLYNCGMIDSEGKPTQRGIDSKLFTGRCKLIESNGL